MTKDTGPSRPSRPKPEFRPRALFERFQLEALATTDSPLDSLVHHEKILVSNFKGRILPTFRPDSVVDPDFPNFLVNLALLGEITGEDTGSWRGYLSALRKRRLAFKASERNRPGRADLGRDDGRDCAPSRDVENPKRRRPG